MIPFTGITDGWVLYFLMFLFCGNLRCSPLTHCYSALFETVEPQINKTNIYLTYPVTVSFSTKWKSILVLRINDYSNKVKVLMIILLFGFFVSIATRFLPRIGDVEIQHSSHSSRSGPKVKI